MVLHMLIRQITSTMVDDNSNDNKVVYVIKITRSLDPNLKFFLNSLKTALLVRSINLRLVIIEADKIIAGQDQIGNRVQGC